MSFESDYIRTDVTAVTLYSKMNLVLAGIGSSFYVYSLSSKKPLQRAVCLNGQKIYGFKHKDNGCCFVVFGGKQFTVVVGPENEDQPVLFKRLFEPIVCDDWLHSAVWGTGETENVSVLTAHNVVQTYNTSTLSEVCRHSSKDNSILYSGLLLALEDGVVVMAGTVYSEVIIHVNGDDERLQQLKGHKGVIFSISCQPQKEIIVTTSDDRSVRVWGPNSLQLIPWTTTDYWKKNEIVCKHELYGHNARVMRCSITAGLLISVGEDSRICFWTHKGELIKKMQRHQNSGIWSIEAVGSLLLTGGGDGSVTAQSISSMTNDHHLSAVINYCSGKPKQIGYSLKQNLYILNEAGSFVYYNVMGKYIYTSDEVNENECESSYLMMCVSMCRTMCAMVGRNPFIQVFIENGSNDGPLVISGPIEMSKPGEIRSMHWAGSRHLVLCTNLGIITVMEVKVDCILYSCVFHLPKCKESWLTCAAVDDPLNLFVVGDRCGGLHLFRKGFKDPVMSLCKLHGRYGPTSITIIKDNVITTGRDGTIHYYKIHDNVLTGTATSELNFRWVDRFLNINEKIICGFKEKMFVVYNLETNEMLLEVACGGGHRSWDALYLPETNDHNTQSTLKLVYLKNATIHTEQVKFGSMKSITFGKGSHAKDINCLKTLGRDQYDRTLFVSGGEDTTLRISTLEDKKEFEDIAICKHLSSVRTLKVIRVGNEVILISAGGRAQICIKLVRFLANNDDVKVETHELIDFMLKGTDTERKANKKNKFVDYDPETRIMDLDYIQDKNIYTIFAGCSDARLRVFVYNSESNKFNIINESTYSKACILKTVCVNFNKNNILITAATRGELAFWNATNVNTDSFKPYFSINTNKTGINSVGAKIVSEGRLLIATGGDDNAIHLNVLNMHLLDLSSMQVQCSMILDSYHSSAITGICLVEDFMLSASIDQRITLYKVKVTDHIECNFVYQSYSDVADIKGMEIISHDSHSMTVCVFGKGIEVFKVITPLT